MLYDNLSTATVQAYDSAAPTADGPLGASFSTGSSAFDLTQVDISVGLTAAAAGGSFMVFVAASDVGGAPGGLDAPDLTAPLAVLAGSVPDSSISSRPQTLAYTLTSPLALSADSRYWVVVTAAVGSSTVVGWSYAMDNDEGGSQVEDEYYYSRGITGHNSDATPPYIMAVAGDPVSSGNSVPEPAGLGVIGAGLVALGMARKRLSAGRG